MNRFNIIVLITCIGYTQSGKLPDFITRCKFHHPTLPQCIKDNVDNIKPHLKDGIRAFHMPSLNPFHLDKLTINPSQGLVLKLSNIDIYGLDTGTMTDYNMGDTESNFTMHFDHIRIQGNIDINGQLLIIPVSGTCQCFLVLDDFLLTYSFDHGQVERNGKLYFTTKNHKLNYVSTKMNSDLEKLFTDKILGEQLKTFMEENWQEINDEFRPVITDTIIQVATSIVDGVTNSMPLNELFIVDE